MSRATPREVALEVLLAVHSGDAYANLLLPTRLVRAGLSGTEAAFATQLTYGTLRAAGRYDWIIQHTANRKPQTLDPLVLVALRLGTHQLLDTRVAQHAAVNETVALVRRRAGRGAAGFVNANLRAIAALGQKGWQARIEAELTDPRDRLSVSLSHPRWIVDALTDALAREGAEAELPELLAADNLSPQVQLAAVPGFGARDELADARTLVTHPAAPTALQLHGGDPATLPAVLEHRARVQDAGSQLVALALTRAQPLTAGERLLDLCAGPGGKSVLLAAEAKMLGAEFTANEVVPARAGLVRKALAPYGEFTVTEHDGRDYLAHEHCGAVTRVLVDAPCTGLGALRRRPEARWRKRAEDVTELVTLQRQLLRTALNLVAPQGLVAYVTCSPHPAETTEVVSSVLDTGATVLDTRAVCQLLAPTLEFGSLPLGDGTAVQLWPHRHGTDAMFLALLRAPAER